MLSCAGRDDATKVSRLAGSDGSTSFPTRVGATCLPARSVRTLHRERDGLPVPRRSPYDGMCLSGGKPILSIPAGTTTLLSVRSDLPSRPLHRPVPLYGRLGRLEPDAGKLARPVLRGGGSRKAASLPGENTEFLFNNSFSLPSVAPCLRVYSR